MRSTPTLGRFEEFLAGEGVDFACVLAELNEMTVGVCTNGQVRDFCRGRPRLIPFCDVNPYLFARPAEELKRLVEEDGFRGLKLYPTYQQYFLNAPRIYPVYAMAQRLEIPVLIHTGSSIFSGTRLKYGDPLHLDDVAVDFPDLKLVMAHSGRGFWYDRAFFMSRLHKKTCTWKFPACLRQSSWSTSRNSGEIPIRLSLAVTGRDAAYQAQYRRRRGLAPAARLG